MLPEQAQNALDGWITAAAPVVKKLYGETETEWPEVRRQYMHGMLNLFPAIRGVSYNTTMLGSTPALCATPDEAYCYRNTIHMA